MRAGILMAGKILKSHFIYIEISFLKVCIALSEKCYWQMLYISSVQIFVLFKIIYKLIFFKHIYIYNYTIIYKTSQAQDAWRPQGFGNRPESNHTL